MQKISTANTRSYQTAHSLSIVTTLARTSCMMYLVPSITCQYRMKRQNYFGASRFVLRTHLYSGSHLAVVETIGTSWSKHIK